MVDCPRHGRVIARSVAQESKVKVHFTGRAGVAAQICEPHPVLAADTSVRQNRRVSVIWLLGCFSGVLSLQNKRQFSAVMRPGAQR